MVSEGEQISTKLQDGLIKSTVKKAEEN
jgi:hypothetical protein